MVGISSPSDIRTPSDWFNSPTAIPVGILGEFGGMIVQLSVINMYIQQVPSSSFKYNFPDVDPSFAYEWWHQ